MAIKYPDVAKEWHPTKNENLKPSDFATNYIKSLNKDIMIILTQKLIHKETQKPISYKDAIKAAKAKFKAGELTEQDFYEIVEENIIEEYEEIEKMYKEINFKIPYEEFKDIGLTKEVLKRERELVA